MTLGCPTGKFLEFSGKILEEHFNVHLVAVTVYW
jgi:hypothetical protein